MGKEVIKQAAVAYILCVQGKGACRVCQQQRAIARSILAFKRYVRQDIPIVSAKSLRSVRSDTATARLTSSAVTPSRCALVYASAAATIGEAERELDVVQQSLAAWTEPVSS